MKSVWITIMSKIMVLGEFFLLFCLLSSVTEAQTYIDSQLVKIKDQPDTAKIKFLLNLSWKNRNNYPKHAIETGELALSIAHKGSLKRFEAKSYNMIGLVYRSLGDYDRSLTYFMNARGYAEECRDSIEIAYAENNIGGNYRLKSYQTLALEHVLRGLRIFERLNYKTGKAFCTLNMGLIYKRQNNFEKALEYFELTYKIRDEIKDRQGAALALSSIGDLYSDSNELEKALLYYKDAEKEYSMESDKSGIIAVWAGIGDVYYKQKDYQNALRYHTSSLNLSRQIRGNEGNVISEKNIGLIYAGAGKFAEGERYLSHALQLAHKGKDNYLILSCYGAFSKFFEEKGDLNNSLKYLKMYNALKDSTITQENIASVGELEAIYKNEKTLKENAILLKDKELSDKQMTYLIILSVILIASSIVIYTRFLLKKRANKKLNEISAAKDKFFGIIAHDLKNPFNAIFSATGLLLENFSNQTDEHKLHIIKEIENSARQTYKLLENLLYWSRAQAGIISFKPKILDLKETVLETIYLLEGTANNKSIKLTSDVPEGITAFGDEDMFKTVLRNLISNAIKFTNCGGTVNTVVKKAGNYIETAVIDSGTGMPPEIISTLFEIDKITTARGTNGEKGTGLGLILCKEFVEKNNGKIHVESTPGTGSKFIFTVPAINK